MSTPETSNAYIQVTTAPPLPYPGTPSSPYHLTEEQVRFFDENGYLILKNWVTGALLTRLQGAAERWIAEGERLRAEEKAGTLSRAGADLLQDLVFAERDHGEVFFRVNYVHNKGERASLELLGSPQVLGVAESLCGPNFVPTYESLVFKKAGDGEKIPWHQDAVHTRTHRNFNLDLYLDESKVGGGALRVVPRSQRMIHDACAVAERYGWDLPGVIHVEMEPGDVLLHDVMVLHGSERTLGGKLRRTLYYEFRAAEQILAEGPWDREWIERRLRLVPLAQKHFAARFPDVQPFGWGVDDRFRPAPLGDDAGELKVAHLYHAPGSYCSASSAPKEAVARAMAKLEGL